MPLSHYDVLGTSPDAAGAEIRRAYRKQVLVWHPDRQPKGRDSQRRFLAIQNAYEVLTDAGRRRAYDELLTAREKKLQREPPPSKSTLPHIYPRWLRDVLFPQPLYEPIFNRRRFQRGLPLTKILIWVVGGFITGLIVIKATSRKSHTETHEQKRAREMQRVKVVEKEDSAWFESHGPLLRSDSVRDVLMKHSAADL